MIAKLEHYGVRGVVKQWFYSLNNRNRFVSINGYKSFRKIIKCGVPQGSVLGPLLFLLYINDLSSSVKHSTVHHFADDTNLMCINRSLKQLNNKHINYDLRKITDWLNSNLISLNTDKTEFVIFRKPKQKLDGNFKIKFNGKRIFASSYIKYLGVLIDEHLTWNYQVFELSKKLNRANSMLSKIRHYVDKMTLRFLYFSLFSFHLNYCCQVWGQNGNHHIHKILSLQISALRIISFKPFHSDVSTLYSDLKITCFKNAIKIANLLFVFDSLKNNLPLFIGNFFTLSRDVHSHFTRNVNNGKLIVPKFNSVRYGKNFIKYRSVIEWNKSLTYFKNNFNSVYGNNYYYHTLPY